MELTIAVVISIIGCVISVSSFVLGRKDKSNKDEASDGYRWGAINEKLTNIDKTLEKIENKLDSYDIEIDKKIMEALEHHIKECHKER